MNYIDKLFCEKFSDEFRRHVGTCPTCLGKLADVVKIVDDIPMLNVLTNHVTGGKSLSVVLKELITNLGD